MSIPEEAGKVASGTVEALKGSPGLLAVILLNLIILGVIYFSVSARNQQVHEQTMAMLDRCFTLDQEKK